jgi:signal transduction histidine kinase
LILAPFFALSVWLAGYFFSAKAVEPVGETLELLRRFVADAGHEFNTPISTIEASVQTLEELFIDQDIPLEVLEGITRASARMRDLAANLMLLARMENPELYAKRAPVNLTEFLPKLVREFSTLAQQKEITISCHVPSSLVILGHEESLRTMVSNLLDNALRYTEQGGTISLNVTSDDTSVMLSVEDNGIGIPAESLHHIFERFYRVDKSRSRAAGGSGLGLSIVKAIVEAHKGIIKAESQPGVGSKFTVTLPARS